FEEKPLTPAALAGALPKGAVLVDYLFYYRSGLKDKDGKPHGERQLVAFVIRKGKPVVRVDLGPEAKAVSLVHDWREQLVRGKAGGPAGAEARKALWSPLERHLTGAKVVLISPDGALANLPFAALPGKKAGTYLIEDVALAIVPVPQMLPDVLRP